MLSLIFASINWERRKWKEAVVASREIMNLGHGLSYVKRQTDAAEDADELMQKWKGERYGGCVDL